MVDQNTPTASRMDEAPNDFGGDIGGGSFDDEMPYQPPAAADANDPPTAEHFVEEAGDPSDFRVEENDADGKTFGRRPTMWEAQYHKEKDPENPYYPFRDAEEWELVHELSTSSESNEWLNRLLKCKLVSNLK